VLLGRIWYGRLDGRKISEETVGMRGNKKKVVVKSREDPMYICS
jgi:hypothetical protein